MARNAHFCAYTGKAAMRLIERGAPASRTSTIHRLIYKSVFDEQHNVWIRTKKSRNELDDIDLIIVDEASMVDAALAKDLISFGRPILSAGDSFQLPPPKDRAGAPFMDGCDLLLREVHRQAEASPILRAATALRDRKSWARYVDGKALRIVDYMSIEEAADNNDVIICGRNTTRHSINRKVRKDWLRLDKRSLPVVAEILLCLKNDYETGVFNGELWQIDAVEAPGKKVRAISLELTNVLYVAPPTRVRVPLSFFESGEKPERGEVEGSYQEFNFGYALTCHKSQGSEWPSVVIVDESSVFREMGARWLYTGLTRASKKLTIVTRSIRS